MWIHKRNAPIRPRTSKRATCVCWCEAQKKTEDNCWKAEQKDELMSWWATESTKCICRRDETRFLCAHCLLCSLFLFLYRRPESIYRVRSFMDPIDRVIKQVQGTHFSSVCEWDQLNEPNSTENGRNDLFSGICVCLMLAKTILFPILCWFFWARQSAISVLAIKLNPKNKNKNCHLFSLCHCCTRSIPFYEGFAIETDRVEYPKTEHKKKLEINPEGKCAVARCRPLSICAFASCSWRPQRKKGIYETCSTHLWTRDRKWIGQVDGRRARRAIHVSEICFFLRAQRTMCTVIRSRNFNG